MLSLLGLELLKVQSFLTFHIDQRVAAAKVYQYFPNSRPCFNLNNSEMLKESFGIRNKVMLIHLININQKIEDIGQVQKIWLMSSLG